MNFVQLVEELRTECAVTGSALTTVQGTLPSRIQLLKNWIINANIEIQSREADWEFMRVVSSHTIPQYAGLLDPAEYSADGVASWRLDSFRLADSGDGFDDSTALDYCPYEVFRYTHGFNQSATGYQKPSVFSYRPNDKALFVGPNADLSYELFYDYYRTPQTLSADADIPLMPERFHRIIVFLAMTKYGRYEAAPEVLVDGRENYQHMLTQLQRDQLPEVEMATLR